MTTTKQKNESRHNANNWTYKKPRVDIAGKVFGRFTVVDYHGSKNHSTYWNCKCECGELKTVRYSHLSNGQIISCGCARLSGHDHPKWNGHEEITGTYLHNWRTNAASRNIAIDVEPNELWEKFVKQNRVCALSGKTIGFDDHTASLDRINSDLPYEKNNIQWVHKNVNQAKMGMPEQDFIQMCKEIVQHNERMIMTS